MWPALERTTDVGRPLADGAEKISPLSAHIRETLKFGRVLEEGEGNARGSPHCPILPEPIMVGFPQVRGQRKREKTFVWRFQKLERRARPKHAEATYVDARQDDWLLRLCLPHIALAFPAFPRILLRAFAASSPRTSPPSVWHQRHLTTEVPRPRFEQRHLIITSSGAEWPMSRTQSPRGLSPCIESSATSTRLRLNGPDVGLS